MKPLTSFTGLVFNLAILLSLAGCHNKESNYAVESKALLDLEREAIQREFQNDTAFLSSVMDTTFVELTKTGVKRKHDVLQTIYQNNSENKEKGIVLDSFKLEEPLIHLYDNAAVVTFVMHTFRKAKDSAFERRTRFYDVWVKRANQWKAVTWQASPVD